MNKPLRRFNLPTTDHSSEWAKPDRPVWWTFFLDDAVLDGALGLLCLATLVLLGVMAFMFGRWLLGPVLGMLGVV